MPVRASRRARWTPRHTWGPWANARWLLARERSGWKPLGVREERRITVGRGDRDPDEVASLDGGLCEVGVGGGVAVDHGGRRLEPERLLDHGVEVRRVPLGPGQRLGMLEQVQDCVGDHPLGRLDAAEQEDRGVRNDMLVGETGIGPDRSEQRVSVGHRRLEPVAERGKGGPSLSWHLAAGGDLGHGGDDPVVPAEHVRDLALVEAERPGHDRCGQRPRERAPQLGGSVVGEAVDEALGVVRGRACEALSDRSRPEGGRERGAVAGVDLAVQAEHAGPHHLCGGEARVVDCERL